MSLPVVATITAQPGSEALVGDALSTLVAATRGEEGCLSYELYRSTDEPAVFVTVELWRDRTDLDAHMQAPHMNEAMVAAGEHLASPPVIRTLDRVES